MNSLVRKIEPGYPALVQRIFYSDKSELNGAFETDEQLSELEFQFDALLSTLTPREENILTCRYGLKDGRAKSLKEVALLHDITANRVRQIEQHAFRKLRHPSRRIRIKDYLEPADQLQLQIMELETKRKLFNYRIDKQINLLKETWEAIALFVMAKLI